MTMIRKCVLAALSAVTFGVGSVSAQENPLWLRYPAVSPDGQLIAFAYKGDLYTVPVSGGEARQLTTNAAYDSHPVWSPDGQRLAFVSTREGNKDVWVMSRHGGQSVRLTTNSANETPVAWADNEHVLFMASGMPTVESIMFPSGFQQVYSAVVPATLNAHGWQPQRPTLFSALPMEEISINAQGDVLYHDMKGYEDDWRKHHTSPITRDIWLKSGNQYNKLTSFNGEDRQPRWLADGKNFCYLSEQDGTFNVYRRAVSGGTATQLTHYKGNPVRFLSVATNGLMCFGYDGEIYTLQEGGTPKKVAVTIVTDQTDRQLQRQNQMSGATEIAVSPKGKEIAFIMHGDVYVTSIDYRTTKQITDTPEQERDLTFAPDGRSVAYASERDGLWRIYQSSIVKGEEKQMTYATQLKEELLVKGDSTMQQPMYSPDGKSLAFLENRGTIKAVDLKSKKVRKLFDGSFHYSYSDGDVWFEWSPDSRWLLTNTLGMGGWQNQDIALVPADGKGAVVNLTQSGYNDGDAKWVLDGKAMIFQSDRAGYRSHGSWGAQSDAYIMFFDLDAYEKFRRNKEEQALADAAEKEAKDKKDKEPLDVSKKQPEPKDSTLVLDVENCRDRVLRLTVNSSSMGDMYLTKDGSALYYQAAFEGGYDLWKHDFKERSTQLIVKGFGGGSMQPDADGNNLYMASSYIKKYKIGDRSTGTVEFDARFNYRPYEERANLFNHVWQQVKDKFYDPQLHSIDWEGYRKSYERFLPYINNNFDFAEMLSEMLGELNASHTGCRYRAGSGLQTAQLGVFYDYDYQGDGLRIKEVVKGGPFSVRNTGVKAGCVIEAIDGTEIKQGMDYNYLLDGKSGSPVRVTVRPEKGKSFDVVVKPISMGEQQALLYKRWVEHNRHVVDSLSHGQLAYVHVKAMDSESFRTVFSELLSDRNRNRKAVIVDERHNGGGWLHDDLCTLLDGKQYQNFVPRGQYIGRDPWNKWVKPSCVLVCEDDYSNGHGFPLVYKTLGIGKLIGTPVAGTMTAVWWETLMDRSLVFGIPQVGIKDMQGRYGENQQLDPDITVYNTPEDYLTGHDRQLERAVEEMMK